MKHVPFEIFTEIFLHLPCKSLARFKSVCKQWHCYINNVQFVDKYNDYRSRISTRPSYFLVNEYDYPTTDFRTFHLYNIGRDRYTHTKTLPVHVPWCYEVMSSSNGLVLLHGVRDERIAFLNPTAEQEIIALPDFPEPYQAFVYGLDGLDTYIYCNLLGFGFHPQNSKYKVVQLVRDLSGGISRCHVLTLGRQAESSWRAVEESLSCDPFTLIIDGDAHCAHGKLYWENRYPQNLGDDPTQILKFDLSTEKLKMITSPSTLKSDLFAIFNHLAVLDRDLCFVDVVANSGLLHMDIWRLNDSSSDVDWARLYILELGPYMGLKVQFFPVCIMHDRILVKDLQALYYYDVEKKSLEIYEGNGEETVLKLRNHMKVHGEALVLLN